MATAKNSSKNLGTAERIVLEHSSEAPGGSTRTFFKIAWSKRLEDGYQTYTWEQWNHDTKARFNKILKDWDTSTGKEESCSDLLILPDAIEVDHQYLLHFDDCVFLPCVVLDKQDVSPKNDFKFVKLKFLWEVLEMPWLDAPGAFRRRFRDGAWYCGFGLTPASNDMKGAVGWTRKVGGSLDRPEYNYYEGVTKTGSDDEGSSSFEDDSEEGSDSDSEEGDSMDVDEREEDDGSVYDSPPSDLRDSSSDAEEDEDSSEEEEESGSSYESGSELEINVDESFGIERLKVSEKPVKRKKGELEFPINSMGQEYRMFSKHLGVYDPVMLKKNKDNGKKKSALDWKEVLEDYEKKMAKLAAYIEEPQVPQNFHPHWPRVWHPKPPAVVDAASKKRQRDSPIKKNSMKLRKTASDMAAVSSKVTPWSAAKSPKKIGGLVKKKKRENPNAKPVFVKGAIAAQIKACNKIRDDLKCRTQFTAMEFCAGGGGLATGLKNAGWRTMLLLDFVAECSQSLQGNFPGTPVLLGDLKDCLPKKSAFESLDLLCAGLPCQSFSLLGKRDKFENEQKGLSLWKAFIRIARGLQPKLVVVENVAPCMHDINKDCPEICSWLDEAGYNVTAKVLNSNHLGVPQDRKRMILVCTNKKLPKSDDFRFDQYVKFDPTKPAFKEVFEGSPKAPCMSLGHKYQDMIVPLIPPGGNFSSIKSDIQVKLKKMLGINMRPKDLRRPDPNKPCPTITTAGGAMSGWGCILHPTEDRPLNLIEAARVQTFPDDHYFGGEMDKQVMQIGNAVPCKMGERLGWAFANFLLDNAANEPKHFEKIPEEEHEWLDEHMDLRRIQGDRGTAFADKQYPGCYWHPYETNPKDGPVPKTLFYESDFVVLDYFDGSEVIQLDGVVERDLDLRLCVSYHDPVVKRVCLHTIQDAYSWKKGSKKKPEKRGVCRVSLADRDTSLRLVDVEADHRRGVTMVKVSRRVCGRVTVFRMPMSYANKNDKNPALAEAITKFRKKHKIKDELKHMTKFKLICPYIKQIRGHRYQKGTRVEVFRTKANGKFDNHPVEGRIKAAGFDKLWSGYKGEPKEYRDVEFVDAREAVAPKFHHLIRGNNKILRMYIAKTGKMWISQGIYMKIQPLQEKDDKTKWIIDNRTKAMNACKMLVCWGEVNGKEFCSWTTRGAIYDHHVTQGLAHGMVRCVTDRSLVNVRLIDIDKHSLKPGTTYLFLHRTCKLEPGLVLQRGRKYVEVAWKDGVTEIVPRKYCVIKSMNSSEQKEMKLDIPRKSVKFQCSQTVMPIEYNVRIDPRGSSTNLKPKPIVRDSEPRKNELTKKLTELIAVPARRACLHCFGEPFHIEKAQFAEYCIPKGDWPANIEETLWKDLRETLEKGRKVKKARKNTTVRQYFEPGLELPLWKRDDYPTFLGNHGNWYIGQRFDTRNHAYAAGVQRQTMRGISTFDHEDGEPFTDAICFGNGYADDTHDLDLCNAFYRKLTYTGEGRESAGDQEFKSRGNWGLKKAMEMNVPIRLLIKTANNPERNGDGEHYMYGGLFNVQKCWLEKSAKTSQKVTKFEVVPYKYDNKSVEKDHKKSLKYMINRFEKNLKLIKTPEDLRYWAGMFIVQLQGQIYRKYPQAVQDTIESIREALDKSFEKHTKKAKSKSKTKRKEVSE